MALGIDKIKELKKEILELIADGQLILEDGKFTFLGDLSASIAAVKDAYDIYNVVPGAIEEAKDIDKEELAELGKMLVELIGAISDAIQKK